jgi:hypothetical protein
VWQPNKIQWRVIWALAVALILLWPPLQGRSLGIKFISWLADPTNSLPHQPAQFSFDDEDDMAAMTAHDGQEADYERVYSSSAFARLRLRLRDMEEPFDPSTERQVLGAIAVLSALIIWRLGA